MRSLLVIHYYYEIEHFVPFVQQWKALLYNVRSVGICNTSFKDLMDMVRESDIVLFWVNTLPLNQLKCLRLCFPRKLFIRYTWYEPEPANWAESEYFDLYFSSSCNLGMYLPPGVDCKKFQPVPEEKKYDVVVYAHSIFGCRERVLEKLRYMGLKVGLFGGAAVGEMYPDIYAGEVFYDEMPESVAQSKIHLVLNKNPNDCITDTLFKVMACGGVVLTNLNKAMLYGKCAILDEARLEEQLRELLDNYDSIAPLMSHKARLFAKQYDWKRFVERIHIKIAEKLFDCSFYIKTYEHSFDASPATNSFAVFEYWKYYGLPLLEVPFAFSIPSTFAISNYRGDPFLANKSDHYIYWYAMQSSVIGDEDSEIVVPSNVAEALEAVFAGACPSTLPNDVNMNAYVKAFFE